MAGVSIGGALVLITEGMGGEMSGSATMLLVLNLSGKKDGVHAGFLYKCVRSRLSPSYLLHEGQESVMAKGKRKDW
jgi:hypothetical protein